VRLRPRERAGPRAAGRRLAALLHGHGGSATRLSDAALVKLFRLLRLARRLLDLEAGVASQDS
jgi:hypothetical protein